MINSRNENAPGNDGLLKPFTLAARIASIRFAFNGLRRFFREEHNAWVHLLATLVVVFLAWWLEATRLECIALAICTGMVWMAEIFNTSIERIMDHLSPGRSNKVKYIKDLAAAAVLVASIVSAVSAFIIFIPKFF